MQEHTEADSMPAAVGNMIAGLLHAGHAVLHDDKLFDRASFGHLMALFKVRSVCFFNNHTVYVLSVATYPWHRLARNTIL